MNRSKWMVAALVLATAALGTGCAHAQYRDRDNNPPGWRGGHGTNWENPPGPRGGPGTSRDAHYWRDRDSNPPGWRGGPGTNWENPPGWRGGPGASPDYRYWRYGGQRYRFERVGYGYYYSPLRLLAPDLRAVERGCALLARFRPESAGSARRPGHQLGESAGLERWSGDVA